MLRLRGMAEPQVEGAPMTPTNQDHPWSITEMEKFSLDLSQRYRFKSHSFSFQIIMVMMKLVMTKMMMMTIPASVEC